MTTNPSTGLPEELEKTFIPSWVEHVNERSWWHDIDGGHYECAASVLREGK